MSGVLKVIFNVSGDEILLTDNVRVDIDTFSEMFEVSGNTTTEDLIKQDESKGYGYKTYFELLN